MSYILAIDAGTSSTRAFIFNLEGKVVKKAHRSLNQHYPKPNWVEHCPKELWEKTQIVIREVTQDISNTIIACGITNQRETTVIWDKSTSEPIAPAIVWQDRRTTKRINALKQHESMIQEKTGLFPNPYFSATKFEWFMSHCSEAQSLAASGKLAFGTIDTYLLWQLTKGKSHKTDVTNASRTMLFNIHSHQWDDALIELFNLPKTALPEVCASTALFGHLDDSIIGNKVPITGIAGDQQAALVGQQCFKKGEAKATFGTGAFLLLNTGNQAYHSDHKVLTTLGYQMGDTTHYCLEGSIFNAGTIVKWARDELRLFNHMDEIEPRLNQVQSNQGVFCIPGFTGLGAPFWKDNMDASFIGLTLATNQSQLLYAALESIAFQFKALLDSMISTLTHPIDSIAIDGGMAKNQWLMQKISTLCGINLYKYEESLEMTVLGAALLAGVGAKLYETPFDKSPICFDKQQVIEPDIAKCPKLLNDYEYWRQAVHILSRIPAT